MTDPAPHRVGQPSPLIFHLASALSAYAHALLAAPRADSPIFPWCAHLAGEGGALGPDLDQVEIAREIAARLNATVAGLDVWQAHPYRRRLGDPPVLWQRGSTRVLDFGAVPEATDPSGPPVLVVPSLINRSYILDLKPGRSVLRALAARGLRPLLIDWGDPEPAQRGFDLDRYGAERLLPAMRAILEATGRQVQVLGYCMGGTLATGLAARAPDGIRSLVTIGAPWDFASTRGIAGGFRAMIRAQGPERTEAVLMGLGDAFGMVPVSLFQMLFALVNPIQAALKFQRLARMDPAGPAAELFIALEDWLSDGVAMPAPAACELLIGWQIRNDTALGRWRFLGGPVEPSAIEVPALVFCGRSDSIAPPPLAEPLAAAIPRAHALRPETGHVGMVVGTAAAGSVIRPLADFLRTHAG
jgi:polyhydroxyalkanoate synthase